MRIGHGYDVHRFANDRKLIIGGVHIPYELGLLGHSDADVLVHAIMDALIGAAGLGDIGKYFPDTDGAYKDISSLVLLEKVRNLLAFDLGASNGRAILGQFDGEKITMTELHRFTKEQEVMYYDTRVLTGMNYRDRSTASAGVRFAFKTDSDYIAFDVSCGSPFRNETKRSSRAAGSAT